ncbi:GNAT family N-acetyltransferase [Aureimonas sp. AU4]|uniref:GNAT family N-acetyltransferase n=1 Tax=Aureimonas sp. AU4 TaxID=1638163 RepID=UPI0007827B1C|nr:GNAT family N-acetyltransferase [Aureimonas sp. AU4]
MEIRHEEQGPRGAFVTGQGADRAELTYGPAGRPGVVAFDHTFVPRHLRGRGVAEALLERAVAHAREKGFSVVPACSYVARAFDRSPERYADIDARAG